MARPRVDGNQDTDSFRVRIGEHARARFREVAAGRGLTEAEAVRQAMHLWASMPIGDTKSEGLFGAEGEGESQREVSGADSRPVSSLPPSHPQPVQGEGGTGELPAPGVVTPANPSHPEPCQRCGSMIGHADTCPFGGEPTPLADALVGSILEGALDNVRGVEKEVEGADAPVDDDRAFVDPVPPPSPPEPDEKPPATRAKAPAPKVSKNAAEASDALAAAIAARAKQREPEHVHKSVARKGSTNPGCVSCPAILVGHTWITPETTADPAAPTDDDEW